MRRKKTHISKSTLWMQTEYAREKRHTKRWKRERERRNKNTQTSQHQIGKGKQRRIRWSKERCEHFISIIRSSANKTILFHSWAWYWFACTFFFRSDSFNSLPLIIILCYLPSERKKKRAILCYYHGSDFSIKNNIYTTHSFFVCVHDGAHVANKHTCDHLMNFRHHRAKIYSSDAFFLRMNSSH